MPGDPRIEAYKGALLNTCIRYARTTYPDLRLSNCRTNADFCAAAYKWLQLPYFLRPIENAMDDARLELMRELRTTIIANTTK